MIVKIIVLFGALLTIVSCQNAPTVSIRQGNVIGVSATDGNYFAYYGLPYGGSTSGDNRFKAPTAPPSFPGVFHAIDTSIICAHPTSRGLVGIENCLTLNIFTKNVTTPKPVMVWIEGTDYKTIATNSQKSYNRLVQEDVVVVTVNYRLSIFGFLCLGVEEAPGNAGLKDIIAALKWINENIAAFGGNPGNVVLFGHGSGAAMVDLVTLSPLSRNLVHKVIASSGSALAPWAVTYNPVTYAEAVGDKLGYRGKNRQELAKAFSETDISILSTVLNDFEFQNNTAIFAPCIEDVRLNPNDTFLHDAPLNILRSGNYTHVPFITGYADREGTLRTQEALYSGWLDNMQTNFTNFIQADLTFPSAENRTNVTRSIREFYFSTSTISLQNIEDFYDFEGDTMFVVSIIRATIERSLTSSEPVRLYEFSFRGTFNSDWPYQIVLTGAKYGSIINYLFDFDLDPSETGIRSYIIDRWTAFAKTGIPQVGSNSVTWPIVQSTNLGYFVFSGSVIAQNQSVSSESTGINPHQQRMAFWNNIYSQHYVAPTPVSSSVRLGASSYVTAVFFCQMLVFLS